MELDDAGLDIDRACLEMLSACACEALRRTSRSVTSHYQQALAGAGVRPAQLPILVATRLMGPVPVTALAAQLGLDRTTLTRNLAHLEEQDLVTTQEGDDGRVRLVVLTAAGQDLLGPAYEAWQAAQAGVAEAFGAERLRALVAELAAFHQLTGT